MPQSPLSEEAQRTLSLLIDLEQAEETTGRWHLAGYVAHRTGLAPYLATSALVELKQAGLAAVHPDFTDRLPARQAWLLLDLEVARCALETGPQRPEALTALLGSLVK
jgi:hypothetical protein